MRNKIQFATLIVLGMIFTAIPAPAVDFAVSSATFQPNDNSISLSVTLSNPGSTSINLAAFSFELAVTPVSPRRVEFDAVSQPDSLSNSNYIFYGNSADYTTPLTPWSVKSTGGGVNNDFVFSDTTDNTLNMTVPANSSKLLANIRLKPGSGSVRPQSGDVYTLSFISAGTSIFDENLNPVSFTTGTGTLSVPVPEPSTYILAIIGAGSIGVLARNRRRSMISQENIDLLQKH